MNPPLFTLLAAVGVALCALLIVASGLIHTSLKRKKAVVAGGPHFPSRILDDLRPVEDLLVDFVRHSPEMAHLLAILAPLRSPASFARLVHEIRIERSGSTQPMLATNLVVSSLFILGLAGLVRLNSGGFVITEVGREVEERIAAAQGAVRAALDEPEKRTDPQPLVASPTEPLSHVELAHVINRGITMTAADRAELEAVVKFTGRAPDHVRAESVALEKELKRATIVSSQDIPPDVITLDSQAELLDVEARGHMRLTPVLPRNAEIEEGKISILAPLGTAMLGYRVGHEFQWHVPNGIRRLKVTNVHFQPEAALRKAV